MPHLVSMLVGHFPFRRGRLPRGILLALPSGGIFPMFGCGSIFPVFGCGGIFPSSGRGSIFLTLGRRLLLRGRSVLRRSGRPLGRRLRAGLPFGGCLYRCFGSSGRLSPNRDSGRGQGRQRYSAQQNSLHGSKPSSTER
jgi:hypothetical protein